MDLILEMAAAAVGSSSSFLFSGSAAEAIQAAAATITAATMTATAAAKKYPEEFLIPISNPKVYKKSSKSLHICGFARIVCLYFNLGLVLRISPEEPVCRGGSAQFQYLRKRSGACMRRSVFLHFRHLPFKKFRRHKQDARDVIRSGNSEPHNLFSLAFFLFWQEGKILKYVRISF